MKNKEECSKIAVFKEKEWYKKKIVETINRIEDAWILEQIHRCIENLLK